MILSIEARLMAARFLRGFYDKNRDEFVAFDHASLAEIGILVPPLATVCVGDLIDVIDVRIAEMEVLEQFH